MIPDDDPGGQRPLYLVCDKRRDGRVRIVSEHTEPRDALEAARLLRWAGTPGEISIASAYRPEATP